MSVKLKVFIRDVNGVLSSVNFWCINATAAAAMLPLIKVLTNGAIESASYSTPLDLTDLTGNTATNANVETARQKMSITYYGVPLDAGLPVPTVTIGIPAPKGTYINGLSGDPTNTDIVALANGMSTQHGEAMVAARRVAYER